MIIANVYFPNGSGKKNDNSRIPYKLDFYAALYKHLSVYEKTNKNILVLGDFNTAHKEIDLACPLSNVNSSGFSLIERLELDRWISCGYVDTFRSFNSYSGQYTWWSNRKNSRNRNIGWRIDYILASKHAIKYIKDAFIFPNVYGSDHCPIGVDVDDRIMD